VSKLGSRSDFEALLVLERLVRVTVGFIEFRLELNPMKTKGMQETFEDIHTKKDRGGDGEPNATSKEDHDTAGEEGHVGGDSTKDTLLEEDEGELLMR